MIPNSPIVAVRCDRRVTVVGSANYDLVMRVPTLPADGETVIAEEVEYFLGGKGQTQAVAARRFGSSVALVASIGSDDWGRAVREHLQALDISTASVRTSSRPTGRAVVVVDSTGANSIVVEQGANADLGGLLAVDVAAIADSAVLLVQLEAGEDVALLAIEEARAQGVHVVLNAAPARPIRRTVLSAVGHLIVNEVEACQLAAESDPIVASNRLAEDVSTVITTLGSRGGRLHRRGRPPLEVQAIAVDAVDTTGAGDSFCGVFAAALAQEYAEEDAFRLGLIAGSIATQTFGSVRSVPDRDAVLDAFRSAYGDVPRSVSS